MKVAKGIDYATPIFDLAIRIYVAKVFFMSGLVKIQSWDSTPRAVRERVCGAAAAARACRVHGNSGGALSAAAAGAGIGGRAVALGAFVFNLVAATSYPDISEAGIKDHVLWGALLAVTFFHGPGKLSLDYFIQRWLLRSSR